METCHNLLDCGDSSRECNGTIRYVTVKFCGRGFVFLSELLCIFLGASRSHCLNNRHLFGRALISFPCEEWVLAFIFINIFHKSKILLTIIKHNISILHIEQLPHVILCEFHQRRGNVIPQITSLTKVYSKFC